MLEVSEEIYSFFQGQTAFTDEMGVKLFPVVAKEQTTYPFAIYTISEEEGVTKDGSRFNVNLSLYYQADKYTGCAAFTDTCKQIIEQQYIWLSSEIGFSEQDQSIASSITFQINK